MKSFLGSVIVLTWLFGASACASTPEPETPAQPDPRRVPKQREPLPPVQSDMPEIVYASAVDSMPKQTPIPQTAW